MARSGHGAVCLGGVMYVVGGENDMLIMNTVEELHTQPTTTTSTNTAMDDVATWQMSPPLQYPRCNAGVCSIERDASSGIYVCGGSVGDDITDTVELYHPAGGGVGAQWQLVTRMPQGPLYAMSVTAHDGVMYIVGGVCSADMCECNLVYCYNTVTHEWTQLSCMSQKRAHAGVSIVHNSIYIIGGSYCNEALDTVERYDIDTDTWHDVGPRLQVARWSPAVCAVQGILYVMGGSTSSRGGEGPPETLASVECLSLPPPLQWNQGSGTAPYHTRWGTAPDMPTTRSDAAAIVAL